MKIDVINLISRNYIDLKHLEPFPVQNPNYRPKKLHYIIWESGGNYGNIRGQPVDYESIIG